MPRASGPTKASPARLAALGVCRAVRTRKAFTQEVLAHTVDVSGLSPEDRAFARLLSLGVTSTSGTLDEMIDRYLASPEGLQPEVRDALRIATYEILFLGKDPYVAVFQGVELVKEVAFKASGLANAVLRRIAESKQSFPFGDPETDNAALARKYAFPAWMAEMLVSDLGYDAAVALMEASNESAPVYLAVNALKADDADVARILRAGGIEVQDIPYRGIPLEGCMLLKSPRSLQRKEAKALFEQGCILVSDAAAQAVAAIALPESRPGSYLEIGSGRGTKTILLQSNAQRRYGAQMDLSILDTHAFKNDQTVKRAETYGAKIDGSLVCDATDLGDLFAKRRFDGILVDVPCSGLGTLRRHPEIRWRLKPQDIRTLARLGSAMLEEAARGVSPGGCLTYATCTVTRAENIDVVRGFLDSQVGKDFEVVPVGGNEFFSPMLSPGSSDAHFAVHMARKSGSSVESQT